MNLDHFSTTVDTIVARDPRFERDAYLFVRDALEFTTKQIKKKSGAASSSPAECHVSSQQLLEGMRQYALQQYGPMVPTVFEHWRVRSCGDHRVQSHRGTRVREVRARHHRGLPPGVQFPGSVR